MTAPRVLPKTLMVLAAAAALILFLTFWRVPFYVSAEGVFVPQQRAWVYAGQSGDINSVLVEHGTSVQKDQVLATMTNRQLELSIAETQGRIDILTQRQQAIEKNKFSVSEARNDQQQTDENINSIKAEISALEEKLAMQRQLMQRTKLLSPMSGQVLSWDVKQKLIGRSVRPEQQLIEIAKVEGPWILELDVADRRAGHLLRGLASAEDEPLKVKFTLAAQPDRVYTGSISKVGTAMHVSDDNSQMLRVEVAMKEPVSGAKQARSGVVAKIYTGNDTSIGYLWLHDICEAFHRHVSFYFAR